MAGVKQARKSTRAHRVAVSADPPYAGASTDYADEFAVTRSPTDRRAAEQWARDGFGQLPLAARQSVLFLHRWVLGFSLGPWSSPEHVVGWRIVTSEPELLHLEARSRLLTGHMVWRLEDERLLMSTFLQYEMRRTASVVWAVLGNVHRAGARYLLKLAAECRSQPTSRHSPR
jgi:hypothetical protein